MKKLLLGAAITTALLSGAANAAITVNANGTPTAATLADTTSVFLSGSSALQELIEKAMLDGSANGICKTGTARKYIDTPSAGSDQNAYLCELNNPLNPVLATLSASATWKSNLLLYKRNSGGSLQGTVPVANSQTIAFLNVTSNTGTCAPIAAGSFVATVNCDYTSTVPGGNNTATIPTFGLSDVNPEIFGIGAELAPNGTAALVAGYKKIPGVAAVFGVVVTTKLRNALQQAQFETTSVCNPTNASYAANAETQACMPNLQSDLVADIFAAYPAPTAPLTNPVLGAGKIQNWNQLKIGATGNLWANTTVAANKPTSSKLHICSRTIGSGTKAQFAVKFLNTFCAAQGAKVVKNADFLGSDEPTQTLYSSTPVLETAVRPMVHAMASGGGLAECLDELDLGLANTSGSFIPGTAYGAAGSAAVRWAIGYQSLDKNATRSKSYRFVKIDGAAPTLENVVSGKYHDWVETVWIERANLTGDLLTLVNEMINSFGKPASISLINASTGTHSFGVSGFLAVPNTVHPAPANGLLDLANPVNPLSYAQYPGTGSGASNACRNPLVYSNNPANNAQGIQIVP